MAGVRTKTGDGTASSKVYEDTVPSPVFNWFPTGQGCLGSQPYGKPKEAGQLTKSEAACAAELGGFNNTGDGSASQIRPRNSVLFAGVDPFDAQDIEWYKLKFRRKGIALHRPRRRFNGNPLKAKVPDH